ncbi:MAG: hypothetical protein M3552_00935 [Planctomycetota bacterium]|nr:hypothetical protein [Planctomycetaceae bacterium]MDQ3329210.1 hypothetical protein [Planctomycetota bacterium]
MRTIAVGLSKFGTSEARSLPYAAADARRFADGLRPRGGVTTLTDAEATEVSVRDALAFLCRLDANETGVVFLASHATSHDAEVRLHLFDGVVSLSDLLRPVWEGPAGRIIWLLDLYRDASVDERPSATSIASMLPTRPGRVLLMSDDGRHGSHVSGELQAGVWAWHLSAVFSGEAVHAQTDDGTVTVASLRSYLAEEVPRSLARAYRSGRQQSPVLFAGRHDEVLIEPIEPAASEMTAAPPLAGVRFFADREVPVKSLGGFRKGVHSVPSDTSASSCEWVMRLAEPDLANELEQTVGRFREHLNYKRRDVRADGPTEGAASIMTPDFSYHLTARQHETEADLAVFRRSLAEMTNAEFFNRTELAAAFPQGFLSLSQPFHVPADVARLIDVLEDEEPRALQKLDYPTDLEYCMLELKGFDGRVRIDREGLTINASGPASPNALAAHFAMVKRLLGDAGT